MPVLSCRFFIFYQRKVPIPHYTHLFEELDPLGCGRRRGESVGSVLSQGSLGLAISQAALDVGLEPLAELLDGNLVNIELQLLLQLIEFPLLGGSTPAHLDSRPARDGVS